MGDRLRFWVRVFFVEALRALARNKLRSALTTLGITIGVAAVIWAVAIGEGGAARAQRVLDDLGDSFVWIEAGGRTVTGVRTGSHSTTTLTPEDAEAIRREVPLVKSVSENVDGNVQLVRAERNWRTRYRGVAPEYADIKRWRIASGAFFVDDHVLHAASVAVIGDTVRRQLFGFEEPVGQVVRVNGFPFQVIGVLAPKGQSASGQDQDDTVLMPWTSALRKLRGRSFTWLDDIVCSAVSMKAVDPAIQRITALLRQRHHIQPGEEDDFNVRRPDEAIKAQIKASETLETLLVTLASISLLIGGIGIMNVMLASVLQRTKEIGVRIAVGATPRAVQMQFLGEAVMLALVGGVLGLAMAAAGSWMFTDLVGWRVTIPPSAAILAIACSAAAGIASGLYPARKASRLDPIDALRSD
ncbi:ABC transporter permease [Anaeromyxobacter oryzae]|uniref:ABC transporter permease n=1 Tax=Anaeromyxobacter oryzae TaxID=2918170 RepID=A0ABN6MVW8_9BACT|nr:ABC transporter permease [Anaeromyxobacter oryzae]BDG05127.1 ABC transporter permease [Anaeromyxobacter oryzae]